MIFSLILWKWVNVDLADILGLIQMSGLLFSNLYFPNLDSFLILIKVLIKCHHETER